MARSIDCRRHHLVHTEGLAKAAFILLDPFSRSEKPPHPRYPLPERVDLLLIPGHPAAFPFYYRELGNAQALRELPATKPFIFSEFPDILG